MNRLFRAIALLFIAVPQLVAAADDSARLKQQLEGRFGEHSVTDLHPSPLPGVYEVVFGTRVGYVSADGKYLLMGDLIDLESKQNLSAVRRGGLVQKAVDAIGENKMIVFAPDKPRRTVTVFTDVDCPYCARLHEEVPALNRAGVKVRYLLYPRAGQGSDTYRRSVAVWCAKDRNKAVGVAKAGGKIEMKTCPNPVDEHLRLGAEVGVEGTPTLVLDDGRILPGYVPAAQLIAALGLKDGQSPPAAR